MQKKKKKISYNTSSGQLSVHAVQIAQTHRWYLFLMSIMHRLFPASQHLEVYACVDAPKATHKYGHIFQFIMCRLAVSTPTLPTPKKKFEDGA